MPFRRSYIVQFYLNLHSRQLIRKVVKGNCLTGPQKFPSSAGIRSHAQKAEVRAANSELLFFFAPWVSLIVVFVLAV